MLSAVHGSEKDNRYDIQNILCIFQFQFFKIFQFIINISWKKISTGSMASFNMLIVSVLRMKNNASKTQKMWKALIYCWSFSLRNSSSSIQKVFIYIPPEKWNWNSNPFYNFPNGNPIHLVNLDGKNVPNYNP